MSLVRALLAAATILALPFPAAAQFDIVGNWAQPGLGAVSGPGINPIFGFIEDSFERADGPTLVDYLGVPINEAGRSRALAYDSSLLVVPEHQCMPHPSTYSFWGPATLRVTADVDASLAVVAYHVAGTFRRADRTIYMDGRPHPPDHAPHTWAGFTTGQWRGTTLVTRTTHLKWGWIRRNGVPTSDRATVTTFYNRNGNVLTVTTMVHDPVYLTETYVKSSDFALDLRAVPTATATAPAASQGNGGVFQCYPAEEVIRDEDHFVPHYLPGRNPFVGEHAKKLGIPVEATLGGAETAYPEYQDRLRR
jgi:hypothetical protein